ncbi:MAG: ABC transporter substrate-binding protein [Planctomycetota bacterium]|nr:ABC transporter substrate-binding protein [Planctomycetota bacterium]
MTNRHQSETNSAKSASAGKAGEAVAPRVASVTPAGTDLLIGIGAGDHLVGVSNYDDAREGTADKPRVGDYQNIDWEKLSPLGAQILIVFYAADRIPPALQERCDAQGIKIVNVKLETLDNIYSETARLAEAVGEVEKGRRAVEALKAKLAEVAARVAGRARPRAILVISDSGSSLAGPGTFLDELLAIAGGRNALSGPGPLYRDVDREAMRAMMPEVVLQLIPDGDRTPQVMKQARAFWDSMPELPAVKNHRVYVLTDWYSLQPGFRVVQLAERFADILHPRGEAQTKP